MDSDDIVEPSMLENLWVECEKKQLDVVYFSGSSFYESEELAAKHKAFSNTYFRKGEYTQAVSGQELFVQLRRNRDYFVSPCLQLIRRDFLNDNNITFYEGIIHEDNLFSFQVILLAKKAFCVNDIYFRRRVRGESVMTTPESAKNVKGYFVCYIKQLEFVSNLDRVREEVSEEIVAVLRSMARSVIRIYTAIDKDEKQNFLASCNLYQSYLFNSVFELYAGSQTQYKNKEKELKKVKRSRSYRLCNALTSPVRLGKKLLKRIN
jgi:hypothetical protein